MNSVIEKALIKLITLVTFHTQQHTKCPKPYPQNENRVKQTCPQIERQSVWLHDKMDFLDKAGRKESQQRKGVWLWIIRRAPGSNNQFKTNW